MNEDIEIWVQDDPDLPCQQCDVTVDYFDRNKIPFTKHGLSEATDEQRQAFRSLGTTAPVVLTEHHGQWAGLRPDKLRTLKKDHRSASAKAGSTSPPTTEPVTFAAGNMSSVSM
ncbi:MAG: hypothetical protein ACTIMA_13360 [Brachybacterium tyrofermentans]|uniref:hypothetical protein n=1 Tax=Brachybacterium alimentarium TaxID=47845 RepID=UPI000DF48EB5|nr:hypothetical protein [Brachybacterium alimentarium]RCS83207.1 hypothetical protein CIK72_02595 [Brachybacterium alimentarium]